jgi:hypothetical protein
MPPKKHHQWSLGQRARHRLAKSQPVADLQSSRATGYLRRLPVDLEPASTSDDVKQLDRVLQPLFVAA